MKKQMKKLVSVLLTIALTVTMIFSMSYVEKQKVKAEEPIDPVEFTGAEVIANGTFIKDSVSYNIYTNDVVGYRAPSTVGSVNVPEAGAAYINLNKAYKTKVANNVGSEGNVYTPPAGAQFHYYFTLESSAKVTLYGQSSTASNSRLSFEKMAGSDRTDFSATTTPTGMLTGTTAVKKITAYLSAGTYVVTLSWGSTEPSIGTDYTYVRVDADYDINKAEDNEWYEVFPNKKIAKDFGPAEYVTMPYTIGKKMNCVTSIGDSDANKYPSSYYSFTTENKTKIKFSEMINVSAVSIFEATSGASSAQSLSEDNTIVLEWGGDYIIQVTRKSPETTYSFNTSLELFPIVAAVDTMSETGWSITENKVTIDNITVDDEFGQFCIYSGDFDNKGYGEGEAILNIKGDCYIKQLVIDCPVKVQCEVGAKLTVGELIVNNEEYGNGSISYESGTTYNETTKTFTAVCTHANDKITTIDKVDATCTAIGTKAYYKCSGCNKYFEDSACTKEITAISDWKNGDGKIDMISHNFGEYVSNNDATTKADGTKSRTCKSCGYKETVTDVGSKIHVHIYAETWSSDATNHWHAAICEHTTEVANKAEHNFGEYTSNGDATTEADGTKSRICSVCGYKETVTDENSKIKETEASGWVQSDNGWWYQNEDGSYPANEWEEINGEWYFFDESGYMATGWVEDGDTWYYLDESGAMATGWVEDGDTWYYLDESGSMATGWVEDGDTWYYLDESGAMATGWVKDGNTWYYLDESGSMATGWVEDGNTWYYMNSDGSMATGWIEYHGDWYYLHGDGSMAYDEYIGEYYVDENGIWV